jgi:hypothetical protein
MTQPRAHIAPHRSPGAFHCVQRCVRRAFLCGVDDYSGQSFEHRRGWIEQRIRLVAECFTVAVDAYAVMSNHLHLVLRIDPGEALRWTDEEVAARWIRLFPPREDSGAAIEAKCVRLLADPGRIETLRERLGNLSWLMRCLAEPIARRANREDGCRGRFWEGRYKCQALCDERALLAAMAYVDLNPIRAGMADRIETSAYTSAAVRFSRANEDRALATSPMKSVAGSLRPAFGITTADYLHILDWTGRQLAPGKRGRISPDVPCILKIIDHDEGRWVTRVTAFGSGWHRAAGSVQDLAALAARLGQQWLKGVRLALKLG